MCIGAFVCVRVCVRAYVVCVCLRLYKNANVVKALFDDMLSNGNLNRKQKNINETKWNEMDCVRQKEIGREWKIGKANAKQNRRAKGKGKNNQRDG